MGKTYKANDRWKKDRRDTHFRNSNKFKHIKNGHGKMPSKAAVVDRTETDDTSNL